MKTKMVIDTQTIVRFWLVPLGIVLAGYGIYSARTALVIIAAALFLALVLNGPVGWIQRHLPGGSRVGGAAISFLLVVAFLGAFITLVIPPIVQQTAKFITTVPAVVENVTTQYEGVGTFIEQNGLSEEVDKALNSIKNSASNWAAGAGGNLISGISSVGGFIISMVLTLVLAFLMLIEGPALLQKLWQLYDDQPKKEYHQHLVHRMYHVVNAYVVGQITVAGIGTGVIATIVLLLGLFAGVPINLVIPAAAIYFVLTLIPLFGSSIAAILIALLLLLNSWGAGVIFIIAYVAYQQIENNIIAPIVQSRTLEMTALWILLAVTIGIYVFGFIGAIISIPLAGCLKVLLDDYIEHARVAREKKAKPLARLTKKA